MIDIIGVGGYFGVVKEGFFEEVTFEPWHLETGLEAAMERVEKEENIREITSSLGFKHGRLCHISGA